MDEDDRKKLDETMAEIDLRLGGLLGKLGDALSEAVARLETGEDGGEVRHTHEIPTPRGPLHAETGVRVRLGALDANANRHPGRNPARPVNATRAAQGARPGATAARTAADVGGDAHGQDQSAVAATPVAPGTDAEPGPASRHPHVEAYRDGARWVICADLPGVSLPEIDVRIEVDSPNAPDPHETAVPSRPAPEEDAPANGGARSLVVETRGARRYALRHPLPGDARTDDMQIVLRNGVLEIALGTDAGDETR